MSNNNDALVLQLQAKIEEKREALPKLGPQTRKTSCLFSYAPGTKPMNINTLDKVDLIKIMADLILNEEMYDRSAARLDLGDYKPTFNHLGYTVEEWFHDIKDRMTRIIYLDEVKKLDALTHRLGALESDDLKRDKELKAIIELLK